ncbi:hypothetical protein ACFQ4N_14185 [Oceanobacillus iheyensis]|uniref:Lipoprotein n=1 Tax=Oceanobacillus iheyensis (strain DSM 14371 / CIP 107618 / JCM 11309 / KCTC 3954 / HTE831) TaxID=221109 RepID=Q8ETC0_OCEIH|nr:hypothetical protein [Oceanobacillus iheyensis]BAC12297.1 hypothetical protein [Oceanobacillus iheyensis HTE831]
MKKSLLIFIFVFGLMLTSGCMGENIPELTVTADSKEVEVRLSSYSWKGTETSVIDPVKVAEEMKATLVSESTNIEWRISEKADSYRFSTWNGKEWINHKEIDFPSNKGRTIHMVIAEWDNQDYVNYLFVTELVY